LNILRYESSITTFSLSLTVHIENVSVSDVVPLLIGLSSKRILLVSFDEFGCYFCVVLTDALHLGLYLKVEQERKHGYLKDGPTSVLRKQ